MNTLKHRRKKEYVRIIVYKAARANLFTAKEYRIALKRAYSDKALFDAVATGQMRYAEMLPTLFGVDPEQHMQKTLMATGYIIQEQKAATSDAVASLISDRTYVAIRAFKNILSSMEAWKLDLVSKQLPMALYGV